jgi:hypothetical protein
MFNGQRSSRVCYQDRCRSVLVRRKQRCGGRGLLRVWASAALAIYMADFLLAAPRAGEPADRAVAKVVDQFFASQAGYQKGDLITRSQVEKVIAKLTSRGWKIPDASSIAKRGLADDSFLVRELSTSEGKKFMRKIAPRPGAYAHLDRLSSISSGQSLVRDLVRRKDGEKMIEYLTTTKGGKNTGSMMAQVRGGVDLNKPTDRIYTADDLTAALNALAKR